MQYKNKQILTVPTTLVLSLVGPESEFGGRHFVTVSTHCDFHVEKYFRMLELYFEFYFFIVWGLTYGLFLPAVARVGHSHSSHRVRRCHDGRPKQNNNM